MIVQVYPKLTFVEKLLSIGNLQRKIEHQIEECQERIVEKAFMISLAGVDLIKNCIISHTDV